MGIVNLTPDSFSGDGLAGEADPVARALAQGRRMVEEGAHILDIGAESTRPGSLPVPTDVELARVVPVVKALTALEVPLSVDTCKPEVMRAAIAAGADMVNDIDALRADGALEAVTGSRAALCVMHMQGQPRSMQASPNYGDVLAEVADFLAGRVRALQEAGIGRDRIVIDPGFGFGKSVEHNYALLAGLRQFGRLGVPLLAGMSRKSMLGMVTGRSVQARLASSVAAALLAAERGAAILRVHDVAATVDALAVWQAMKAQE